MIAKKQMWPLEYLQWFPLWHSFYSKWHSFKVDLGIIKTNILSKIHENYFKNEVSRALLIFDLVRWTSFFLPELPSLKRDLEIIKVSILSKNHDDYLNKIS